MQSTIRQRIAKGERMKKLAATAVTLFTLISCEKGAILPAEEVRAECSLDYEQALDEYEQGLADGSISEDAEPPRECLSLLVEPEPGEELTVNIEMVSFSETQEEKMLQAIERIKIVINSSEFKQRVLAHTYEGEKQFQANDGLSNEEIYEKIMLGAESLLPDVDREMDINVTMYYSNNSTVGYTYPSSTRTWINSKFFNSYNYAQVAKNVVHEWTHKLGFDHDSSRTNRRQYSVPYGVGSIIEDLVNEL